MMELIKYFFDETWYSRNIYGKILFFPFTLSIAIFLIIGSIPFIIIYVLYELDKYTKKAINEIDERTRK